jgi:hypothetical protein
MNTQDLYKLLLDQKMNVIGFDSDYYSITFKNTTTSEILICSKTLAALGHKNEIIVTDLLGFKLRLL